MEVDYEKFAEIFSKEVNSDDLLIFLENECPIFKIFWENAITRDGKLVADVNDRINTYINDLLGFNIEKGSKIDSGKIRLTNRRIKEVLTGTDDPRTYNLERLNYELAK